MPDITIQREDSNDGNNNNNNNKNNNNNNDDDNNSNSSNALRNVERGGNFYVTIRNDFKGFDNVNLLELEF
jgi:hypothetical protein